MRAKRKLERQPAPVNVVSLAAYREAHACAADAAVPAPAARRSEPSEIGLYWRWLALTCAMCTFWW